MKSPNNSRFFFVGRFADREPQSSKRASSPVEKARWEPIVLSNGQPLPVIDGREAQIKEGFSLELLKNLFLSEEPAFTFLLASDVW
jgi:hypothetical protein